MRIKKTAYLLLAISVATFSSSAFAQVGQLNGGGGANAGAGQGAGAAATGGGTTDGPGGVTADGPGTSAAQDGGVAGGNQTEVFVGGAGNAGGFVGGAGLQNQNNSNRQFRGITTENVPAGTTRQQTGTPRRVPVSFRVAFDYPQDRRASLLGDSSTTPMQRITVTRPELNGIAVAIDSKGVATLTGQAPNAAAARLAANLLRLQPGVRKVDNRITVPVQ